MTTLPKAGKTAFGESNAKQASGEASAQAFATKPERIRYRNHETFTARGWLAHRPSWPKDHDTEQGVAITYGEHRVLIAAAPTRDWSRS